MICKTYRHRWHDRLVVQIAALVLALLLIEATFGVDRSAAMNLMFRNRCSEQATSVIVLVDVTTAYDATDRRILEESMKKILSQLTGGERIIIRTISDAFSASQRLLEACIPFCPKMSEWEKLWSTCTAGELAQERRNLAGAIRATMAQLLSGTTELKSSDILRTIRHSLDEEQTKSGRRRMFIFSDMLENSNFLRTRDFFRIPNSKLLTKIDRARLLSRAPNTEVYIFGIGRMHLPNRAPLSVSELRKLMRFWQIYFQRIGAIKLIMNQNLTYAN